MDHSKLFLPERYELVDFGGGHKFEKFSGVPVIRETPAAFGKRRLKSWPERCLRFRKNGDWVKPIQPPDPWLLDFGDFQFELRMTPFGHLGVFVEQAANWVWLKNLDINWSECRAINLFGYTGGTTMALAALGCQVTHVDSAKTVVGWARRNAELSGLKDSPIRWIVEDATKFVNRELKRGKKYEIIVADPPSFGRGVKNEVWKLERDLPNLLKALAELTDKNPSAIVLSCHTPEFDSERLHSLVADQFSLSGGRSERVGLSISTQDKRSLASGSCFRWAK